MEANESDLTPVLAQIDLSRFYDVATHLLPAPVTLALSCNGQIAAIAGEADGASLLAELDTCGSGWGEMEVPLYYASQTGGLAVFALCAHSEITVAHFIVQHGQAVDEVKANTLTMLNPLFECIQTEVKLADELICMADELTARYEELNLVYDTQDQASDYEESHNQLKALVDNCRDYLDVSFSALILRDKDVLLYDIASSLDAPEVLVSLGLLKGQMYTWVTASKQIVVVNDINDKLGSVLCTGVPYKVIAAPVLSGTNDVCGLLVIARTYAQTNFTNNDKNLVDVMSRKASKIIQASYDGQTGFMKRSGFEFLVNRAMQSTKLVGMSHAVFVIDIDRMQVINDTVGYEGGDRVIVAVAKAIQENVRAHDTVARLGGDEFGVLIGNCPTQAAKKVALKIAEAIENLELSFTNKKLDISASIGVTPVTVESSDVSATIASAEVACGSVKERGGNGVNLYHSGDEELVRRKSYMDLVGRIQDTLRTDRFELFCQPIVPLQSTDAELHVEVLLRMRDEDGQVISPGLFIPAAERYHLMPAIDRWVVAKTLDTLEASGVLACQQDMMISINLSGQSLSDAAFVPFVHEVLDRSVVPDAQICFEITETSAIADISEAQRFIASFKERGVQFSLDDFGTGLSSFTYLRQLPIDFLKIDGSFVKEICDDPIAETMVSAINQVGHTMNLKTIGEFVENDAIRDGLVALGVDYGQGYGLGKPSPFAAYLEEIVDELKVRDAG